MQTSTPKRETMDVKTSFGLAGDTYCACLPSVGIVGLACWSGPQIGRDGGPDGVMRVTPGGWFFVPGDDPDHHFSLDAPALTPALSDQELVAAHDAALSDAASMIARRLGRLA